MISMKKFTVFLLVITLTDIIYSVNGRYVDQPTFYVPGFVYEEPRQRRNVEQIVIESEVVIPPELIKDKSVSNSRTVESVSQPEVPNVGLVDSEKVDVAPIQDDKDKVKLLYVLLDAVRAINENALNLIHSFVGKVDDKNQPPSEVELDSGVEVEKEAIELPAKVEQPVELPIKEDTPVDSPIKEDTPVESPIKEDTPVQEIISKELTSESTSNSKSLSLSQLPQIPQVNVPNSIQAAVSKYKLAINNLVKKVKKIPQHFIKKIKSTGLLGDEPQSDTIQQADPVSKPEEDETVDEKPADETVDDKPVEETNSAKPAVEAKPEDTPEADSEATRTNIVGRKLDITNEDDFILADTVVATDRNTPDELAAQVKVILEATKRLNVDSFNLIELYLNQIIDLAKRGRTVSENSGDEIVSEARAAASEIQEITVPLEGDSPCDAGYVLIEGRCQEVYTVPIVPTNPIIEPINNLVKFVGSILEPVVPKDVAESIADQLKIRAEAIVRDFASN